MYGILHTLALELPECRGGFMHVPFIPEQVVLRKDQPSMSLADIARGIEVALQAIVDNEEDIVVVGGEIA